MSSALTGSNEKNLTKLIFRDNLYFKVARFAPKCYLSALSLS